MSLLRWCTISCFCIGATSMVVWMMMLPEGAIPRHGYRGALRRLARMENGLFALFEPLIARLSSVVSMLPGEFWRNRLHQKMEQADGYMGLLVEEFIALGILGAAGFGVLSWVGSSMVHYSRGNVLVLSALGLYLPWLQLNETIRGRQKEIRRGLPSAIEIIALCMGAGMDFPAAIRLVAEPHKPTKSALKRELRVILEQLELGCTRREALRTFAERVPIDAVRDFVNSVIQAEEKGNPLARVIQIQGRMLSQKRSVLAEEAAARAGVLLIVPMMLLMCCILLLLIGPFIVRGGGI